MAINYSPFGITITDDADPTRPPIILPPGSTPEEVETAANAYLQPTPPAADWLGFARWLYQFSPMAEAMDAARASRDPQGEPATTGLPAAMEEARLRQNYVAFALSWGQFLGASQMPAECIAEIAAKAEACHLPVEFVAALQPLRRRARNEDGTWRADDPSTPDVDEAWELSP